jgi:hypothetical protein
MTANFFNRDANFVPITGLGLIATKAITYDGATTGAIGTTTLFTVTGLVAARVLAVVSGVDLTGTGSIKVGIAADITSILASVSATALDVGEIWSSGTPGPIEPLNDPQVFLTNIIQTIAGGTVTAGTLTFYCMWLPLSQDGNVVAA